MKYRSIAPALGSLILVNRSHPLQDFARPELTAPDPAYPHILMERRAALLLAACIRDAGALGQIIPVSGWRSHEEQQAIWDETMIKEGETFTRQYVALPGCSEHESGLAIDLAKAAPEIDFIRPEFPYDGVCGVFRRLAPSYGFVERFRADKQSFTGIAAEPWHFRYVGVPHALLMENKHLCLEEYIDLLRRQELAPLRWKTAAVCASGALMRRICRPGAGLPPGLTELSSPDNDGGIIVTQWEGAL